MDTARTSVDFLCKCCGIIKNGATTINIPDTVGYAIPHEFNNLIKTLRKKYQARMKLFFLHIVTTILVFMANSLAGVDAGASELNVQ